MSAKELNDVVEAARRMREDLVAGFECGVFGQPYNFATIAYSGDVALLSEIPGGGLEWNVSRGSAGWEGVIDTCDPGEIAKRLLTEISGLPEHCRGVEVLCLDERVRQRKQAFARWPIAVHVENQLRVSLSPYELVRDDRIKEGVTYVALDVRGGGMRFEWTRLRQSRNPVTGILQRCQKIGRRQIAIQEVVLNPMQVRSFGIGLTNLDERLWGDNEVAVNAGGLGRQFTERLYLSGEFCGDLCCSQTGP